MITINYKAHIPAGIAFAGGLSMAAGWPAVVPVLIGGAIGGALPDIDIEGSAIEKMGNKTAKLVNKTVTNRGTSTVVKTIGAAVDNIFLAPIAKAWRFLSKNVFGRLYLKLYRLGSFGLDKESLGEKLNWNPDKKPWAHRGGITHSFSFMVTSCVLTVPVAFVFQSPEFLIGAEAGIVSHLVADSFCKSGVKYFFPFQPKIGFDNENGSGRGRDIRLLPKGLQVSTGKDKISRTEITELTKKDPIKGRKEGKLKHREIMWQWIFKILALLIVVALGIGLVGPGGIAFSSLGKSFDDAISPVGVVQEITGTSDSEKSSATANSESSGNDNNSSAAQSNTATSSVAASAETTTTEEGFVTKPEVKGPSSLTKSDVDLSALPKGIIKLPDETLWIVGVGEVTEENLNNPKWTFREDEKAYVLELSKQSRADGIPTSTSGAFTNGSTANTDTTSSGVMDKVTETADKAKDAAGDLANNALEAGNEATGGIFGPVIDLFKGIVSSLFGSAGGSVEPGFSGLTPITRF